MKRLVYLLLVLGLWVPAGVWAADGNRPSVSGSALVAAIPNTFDRGSVVEDHWLVCDRAGGAAVTCNTFDTIDSTRTHNGIPDRVVFSWVRGGGTCAGDTVTPQGSDVSDGSVNYNLGPSGSITLSVGQQMVVSPSVNRYYQVLITDADSSCTDVEVLLTLVYDKQQGGN